MVSAVLEGKAAHIYNLQNIYSWSYDGGTKTRQFNNMRSDSDLKIIPNRHNIENNPAESLRH